MEHAVHRDLSRARKTSNPDLRPATDASSPFGGTTDKNLNFKRTAEFAEAAAQVAV